MSKLHLICIAVSIAAGCQPEMPPPSRPAAPLTRPIEHLPDDPTQSTSDVRDKVINNTETRITAADAARIAEQRSGHEGKPKPEATVQWLSSRECYQRAWDNIHGDPDLQGPVAFGALEDLDRDGRCWSVEAQYGSWLEITYIDEVGNMIYQFNR
jgi:hypothetical protein